MNPVDLIVHTAQSAPWWVWAIVILAGGLAILIKDFSDRQGRIKG